MAKSVTVALLSLATCAAPTALAQTPVWSGPSVGVSGTNVQVKTSESGYSLADGKDTTYGAFIGYRFDAGPFVVGGRIAYQGPASAPATHYVSCRARDCGYEEEATERHGSGGMGSMSFDIGYPLGNVLPYLRVGAAADKLVDRYHYDHDHTAYSTFTTGRYATGPFAGLGADYDIGPVLGFKASFEGEVDFYDLKTPESKSLVVGQTAYRSNAEGRNVGATIALVLRR